MNKRILNSCVKIARDMNTEKSHPEYNSFKHYAFVVKDNKILEYATNKGGVTLYSKFYNRGGQKTHAEAAAYKRAKGLMKRGSTFEVVNIRLNKDGALKNSKPCDGCSTLLELFGCTKVWYSNASGEFDKVKL